MDTMGMGDNMPGRGAGSSPPVSTPEPAPEHDEGPNTIFLSKEVLGDKQVKEGDTLTLTIKSVDPETGDAEAEIGGRPDDQMGGGEGGIDAAFDKAMPADEEGY